MRDTDKTSHQAAIKVTNVDTNSIAPLNDINDDGEDRNSLGMTGNMAKESITLHTPFITIR